MASLFESLVACRNLALGSPTSADIKASNPYTKKNGVSHVLEFEVVRYAHNTSGNTSFHFPFAFSNLFFKFWMMVLFVDSTCPFAHG